MIRDYSNVLQIDASKILCTIIRYVTIHAFYISTIVKKKTKKKQTTKSTLPSVARKSICRHRYYGKRQERIKQILKFNYNLFPFAIKKQSSRD